VVSASEALTRPVYAGDRYKPFGEFTPAEVQARAAELSAAAGWGPTARVASVARGWADLARAMRAAQAVTVADLDPKLTAEYARRLWIVPPGGTLL
jgi:hypothetical protein